MNADSIYTNASGDFNITVNAATKTFNIANVPFTVTDKNIQAGALRVNGKEVSLAGATITTGVVTVPKSADLEAGDVIVFYIVGPPRLTGDIDTGCYIGKSTGTKADFTVTYASVNTLTIGNLPTGEVISSVDITKISVINTSGVLVQELSSNLLTLSMSGSVLTITGFATSFAATDKFIIYTNIPRLEAYDSSLDVQKVVVQNPVTNEYDDVVLLVNAQDLTNAYVDFGGEIDMRGRTILGIYIVADVNNSENVTLQVLGKHTAAGTDEYDIDGISVETLWTTGASDFKKYYEFNVGANPYVQLQAKAATVGATAGDLTINITKKWASSI